jgi:DNA-binding CsgD family transcriptional regulator/PAS domain-containing protein
VIIRDDFSDCLGLIYDAALDQTAWPVLLARLASLFGCHFADSFRRTDDYSAFGGVAHGLDRADYEDVFLGFWVKRNVWGKRRPVVRAGEVVTTRQMMPVEELRASEMYNEYLAPRGLQEGLRLDIWAGEGWIEDISLLRPWSAGPFNDEEIRLGHALMPHLQRGAAVARRLRQAEQLAASGMAALEQLTAAFLVLDRSGKILHANQAAGALLEAADGLALMAAGLAGATPPITLKLHAAIDAACGRSGMSPTSGAVRLPRSSGRPPLALVALPLRPGGPVDGYGWGDAPAALVCVTDPDAEAKPPEAQLMALFGLTQAEAALASGLLTGRELRDIAEQSGRSIHTLRSQLATLMAKTATGRQSELVRLLSRLPLAPESRIGGAMLGGDRRIRR